MRQLVNKAFPVLDRVAVTADRYTEDIFNPGYGLIQLFLDVDARSGTTPTLDVKVQEYVSELDEYVDVPGASFAQLTNVTSAPVRMLIGVGVTAATNTGINQAAPRKFRLFLDVGGTNPNFNVAISGNFLVNA